MSTSSNNENHNSDFLQLEPIRMPKSPVVSLGRNSVTAPIVDLEQVDVDEEINSLFALVNPATPNDNGHPENDDSGMLQEITAAQRLLTNIHQENQVKAAAIEKNVVKVQELKHHSEKLARFNKLQVQQVQAVLKSFEQVRQDITASLDQFGGQEQLQSLLHQNHQPGFPYQADNDPQLLLEITAAQQLLADIHQENQDTAAAIAADVVRVQELRHRSEKLAKFNKKQVQQVQTVLTSFEQVRQEISTALQQFGGQEQLQSLLQQINQSDESLRQAHHQLISHQTDLHASLQEMQQQVDERSVNAANFIQQHKSDLHSLLSEIQIERQQSKSLQSSVSEQLKLATELHSQVSEKTNLRESGKTVGKESSKQTQKNSESIKLLQSEMVGLHTVFDQGIKQEISRLNSLYGEMTSTWSETRRKQGNIEHRQRIFQNWLITLTIAMVILVLGNLVQLFR
jgi:hypothetical protein